MVDSRALRSYQPRIGHDPEPGKPTVWREEILQITPANAGWWATFSGPSAAGYIRYWREPIACWAVKRTLGGRTAVVPLVIDADGLELREPVSTPEAEFRFLESDYDHDGTGGDA